MLVDRLTNSPDDGVVMAHWHLYSPRVLDITGRAELRTKMDTQQPMICIWEQIIKQHISDLL